ncbi:MAG: tRNA pseudouridine(54/55) synthase Pus10 [Candidatus Methanodesulfokora sp.]
MLDEFELCIFCSGSLYGSSTRIPGWIRGLSLLKLFGRNGRPCQSCGNLFEDNMDKIISKALLMLKDYEFSTIKTGVIVPPVIIEKLDRIRSKYGLSDAESVKLTVSRRLDEILSSKIGVAVEEEDPDVMIIFDFNRIDVSIQIKPVYIYGRYRKLERGISQSRWVCPQCNGVGCEKCSWTGYKYPSVEKMVGDVLKKAFLASEYHIHASGREDIDVRMLGPGRPFVMELVEPKKRRADLNQLEREINEKNKGKIEVIGLRYSSKGEVVTLKEAKFRKVYRLKVEVRNLSEAEVKMLEEKLSNCIISQRTPTRVLRRRADIERKRKVFKFNIVNYDIDGFEATVECEGGLYIKELVNGDNGRTRPSVSSLLGRESICKELDVIDILGDEYG